MRFENLIFFFVIFLIRGKFSAADADDEYDKHSISLTNDNFDEIVKKNNHFIMFFAPWCGHCKRLHPLWGEIAEKVNNDPDTKVQIAKVDCTQHQDLCSKHEITGYPTLRFFKLGSSDSIKFKGARDKTSLLDFIKEQLGKETESVDESSSTVQPQLLIELTDETFYDHISSGKHFIKFYAPWCGHCQRLAPTWDDLAKHSAEEKSPVKICKIDCTVYRPICQDFEVKGYPTLLWIEDGKKIEKYSGARDIVNLKDFVVRMAGTEIKAEDEKPEESDDSVKQPLDDAKTDGVLIINGNTHFQNVIGLDGLTFVKFYAPWCGHCQKLQPTWEQLSKKVNSNVRVTKVDCTSQENRELCVQENVDGYPTLFIYKDSKKLVEYNGSRQLDNLLDFIKQHSDGEAHDEL